jgi:hypothetical protein
MLDLKMKYNLYEMEQWVKLHVSGYDSFQMKYDAIHIRGSAIFISCNEKIIPYKLVFSVTTMCINFTRCPLLEKVDIALYEGVFKESISISNCPKLSIENFNIKRITSITISDQPDFCIKSLYKCESIYLTFKYSGRDVSDMDNYIPLNNNSLCLQAHRNISNILSLLQTKIVYVNFLTPSPNFC